MKKQTAPRTDRVFLSQCKNRPYLATCPADIVHAEFYLSLKLQKKVMRLSVRNRGDRAVTAMTVRIQYLDRDERPVGEEITLHLPDMYCPAHQTGYCSKLLVLPYQDIAALAARILSLAYDDGSTEEFSADAYELTPQQAMLDDVLKKDDADLVRRSLGERCVFVPAVSERPDWLCACGAVADGERCSACGLRRRAARRLSTDSSRRALLLSLKAQRIALRALPYAAAAVLLVFGIGLLVRYARYTVSEVLPAERLRVTEAYLAEHRYNEALGYSATKNNSILFDRILDEAVAYYCAEGDFEEALRYERCREAPDYESIYRAAAEAYLSGQSGAAARALSVSDPALYDRILEKMARQTRDEGHLRQACAIALHLTGEEGRAFSDELFCEQIRHLLSRGEYEEAVASIAYLHDPAAATPLFLGVEQELVTRGRYDDAFTVASLTGDSSVFAAAYPTATTTTLRRYYDKFAACMSAAEKRQYLACRLAACAGTAACVNENGAAVDLTRGTLCEGAVSVACGDGHVLVLLADGTVRAYGENDAGQCGCDGLTGVVAIAAGGRHSLVLMENSTVRAFGENDAGQGEVAAWRGVIAIAAGARHSVALLANGTAVACGSNASGQCALDGYANLVGVAAGEYSTVLLGRSGRVAVEGNLSLDTPGVRAWTDVVRVAVGNEHLIALTSVGRVYGAGAPGAEGLADVSAWSRVRAVACGARASYALDASGQLLLCGADAAFQPTTEGGESSES